jgi:acyl dehydratase
VTEIDNALFSLVTMNPQPCTSTRIFSAQTELEQRLFNSFYRLGILVGMTVNDTTLGTTVANLGRERIRLPKPLFHGDTLRARTRVVSMRESKSRPDAGLVELERAALNQRDEAVAVCHRTALTRKRRQAN